MFNRSLVVRSKQLLLGCLLLVNFCFWYFYVLRNQCSKEINLVKPEQLSLNTFPTEADFNNRQDTPALTTTLIEPTPTTSTSEKSDSVVRLLVLVISAPENIERRNAIRKTWMNSYIDEDKTFHIKFVIGTLNLSTTLHNKLLKENKKNKDILFLEDHLDSYHNLTRKVLQMFVWADQNVNFSYLFKIDDDCFPRLDSIDKELGNRSSSLPLYWGSIENNAVPKNEGKWMETDWSLGSNYIAYAQGSGYLLSHELIQYVVRNHDGLRLYNNEDVSVGVWVSAYIQDRVDDKRLEVRGECEDDKLLRHVDSEKDIYEIHDSLIKTGTLCTS